MLKVALITNNLPPVIDGVGDYTDLFASAISKRGIEVIIICKKQIEVYSVNSNVKIYPLVRSWNKSGFEEAFEQLKAYRPHYILLQFVPYSFSRWGIPLGLMGIINQIKNLGKVGIVFHETYIRNKIWPLQTVLVSFLQRVLLKRISQYIPISVTSIDRYEQQLRKIGFSTVYKVAIPANINDDEKSPEQSRIFHQKVSPNKEKIIVAFGSRNYELLIYSFLNVLEKRRDIILVILGKQDNEINVVHSNIIVTGVLSRDEVLDYLNTADLYISFDAVVDGRGGTSNKSGSLASALASGLPIVGFKGDMNNNLLNNIPDLFLIEYNQYSISEAILKYIDCPKSEANKEFWRKNLSIESVAEFYLKNIII